MPRLLVRRRILSIYGQNWKKGWPIWADIFAEGGIMGCVMGRNRVSGFKEGERVRMCWKVGVGSDGSFDHEAGAVESYGGVGWNGVVIDVSGWVLRGRQT